MKKHYAITLFATALFVMLGVKSANAQTTVYYQNFDAVYALPTGWTAYFNGAASTTASWLIDSTNSSYAPNGTDGYDYIPGNTAYPASGLYNVTVQNVWPSGQYRLVTASISTQNFKNLSVDWGSRVTKHFYDGGSYVIGFYGSTDNGATWDSIPYTEGAATSDWFLDNNATPMVLPSSYSQQAHVMFKWEVLLYPTASGTYRIDDFVVTGTSAPSAVNDVIDKPVALVYVVNNSTIDVVAKDLNGEKLNVELFDMLGNRLQQQEMTSNTLSINASSLTAGIYLVRVGNDISSNVTKVAIK